VFFAIASPFGLKRADSHSSCLRYSKLADLPLRDVLPGQSQSNSKLSRCHVRFVALADTLGGLRDVALRPNANIS
jgi:hypothetical protein